MQKMLFMCLVTVVLMQNPKLYKGFSNEDTPSFIQVGNAFGNPSTDKVQVVNNITVPQSVKTKVEQALNGFTDAQKKHISKFLKWIWTQTPQDTTRTFQPQFRITKADNPCIRLVFGKLLNCEAVIYLNGKFFKRLNSQEQFLNVQLPKDRLSEKQPNKIKIIVTCKQRNPAILYFICQQNKPKPVEVVIPQEQTPKEQIPKNFEKYECPQNQAAYFNQRTEQCQCVCQSCSFNSQLHSWAPYPICGCLCKNQIECPKNMFFNKKTCRCECLQQKKCQGQVFNHLTCQCTGCAQRECPFGQVWSFLRCNCQLCPKRTCLAGQSWSQSTCSCQTCNQQTCASGFEWNSTTCSCQRTQNLNLCVITAPCNDPFYFDRVSCSCLIRNTQRCAQRLFCVDPSVFDEITCVCVIPPSLRATQSQSGGS